MFPDEANPTYGTFVKSSFNQLKKIFPVVDKVVMKKNNGSILDKARRYLSYYKESIKSINQNNYDVIYIHYIGHSSIPVLILKKRFKIISNIHGTDILPKRVIQKMFLPFVWRTIRKSDLIIVPSEYFKKIVQCKYKIEAKKIFVSPSGGVNSAVFFPPEDKIHSDYKLKIGFASRIELDKGWNTYLEAISLLRNKDFIFSLIGSGSQKNDLYRLIKEKKLSSKIEIQDSLPQSQLRDYFSGLDCFVFPSKNESLGLIGIEAMACGCPVIGANNSGITSYLKNGYNGLVFEPGNPNDLADKILNYSLLSKEEKNQLSLNAIETAKRFDSAIVEKQLENRLERLMSHV